jgi:oligopeptidase A
LDDNPLLRLDDIPPFEEIRAEHIKPAVEQIVADNRAALEQLIATDSADWQGFVLPFEALDERLTRVWDTCSHLNSVVDDEALRDSYRECLPIVSDYATSLAQDERIYQMFKRVQDGPDFAGLDNAQRKLVENALRDFHLSGVDLPQTKKQRFKEIQAELSQLSNRFEQHLVDATDAWTMQLTRPAEVAGLPESALELARHEAQRHQLDGWLFTLQAPSYMPFIKFADDRELRRQIYEAYVTRASEQGPHAGRWDNGPVIDRILELRRESAGILGFDDYIDYALQTRMAKRADTVTQFIDELAAAARPAAERELMELQAFASQQGVTELEAWDIPYYSEKLRQAQYAISQEDVRPWFPLPRVLQGMFEVASRLYGLRIEQRQQVARWHPEIQFFEIYDDRDELRGRFYLDLYSRKGKRGGAWMGDGISRNRIHGQLQAPLAWLVANFSRPTGDRPALLTHDEVTTLFHEFGHGLHHMLTRIDYPAVGGISGVPWDAVELPSQLMENWCWEKEVLSLISGHYQDGSALPAELVEKLQAAKNFQAGMMLLRQLEFALFDMRLHQGMVARDVQQVLNEVRDEVAVIQPPAFNRFQNGFAHIFAGGYASGYYSYSWAEVLSADAYSLFEETGIFNQQTGRAFMHNILEQGGSRDPADLFEAFRGREPNIDALLRHRGLAA